MAADNILKYFSYFCQKIGFDISCKWSPKETICIKCQILLSGKSKKNIIKLSSAESAHSMVRVKGEGNIVSCVKPLPLYGKIQQMAN